MFFLTILTGKSCVFSKNGCFAASDLFHILTKSIKLYTFHSQVLKSTDVWKMWFIKYTVKMNDCSFQQFLRQNLGSFLSKHWKTVLLKNGTRDFQNSSPFDRLACFYVTFSGNFKRFKALTLQQIFWKTKTFFKKPE